MQASQRAAVAGALSAAFERGSAEPAAASLSMAGALECGRPASCTRRLPLSRLLSLNPLSYR